MSCGPFCFLLVFAHQVRIQTESAVGSQARYHGVTHCFYKTFRTEGVSQYSMPYCTTNNRGIVVKTTSVPDFDPSNGWGGHLRQYELIFRYLQYHFGSSMLYHPQDVLLVQVVPRYNIISGTCEELCCSETCYKRYNISVILML